MCIQSVLGRERYFLQAWLERVKRLRFISEMKRAFDKQASMYVLARLSACHFGPILTGVGSTSKQDLLRS